MQMKAFVIVLMVLSMFALGCTGSESETVKQSQTINDRAQVHDVSSDEDETPVSQNVEWLEALKNDLNFIQADLDSCSMSEEYSDYNTIVTNGKTLVKDVQIAIANNNKFNVTDDFKPIQKEWGMALQDLSDAGNESIQIGLDGLEGKSYSDHQEKEKTLVISFTSHVSRVNAFTQSWNDTQRT